MNTVNVRAYCIRPIFTAIIAIALAFTISCSSDGKDDGVGGKKGPQWCSFSNGYACVEVGKKITDSYACHGFPEFADEDGFFPEGKCEELIMQEGVNADALENSKPEKCIYQCTED